MMEMFWMLLYGCFLPLASAAYDIVMPMATPNLTDYLHTRQKRHQLIYRNGGTIRLVVGPVMPTQLEDAVSWRGLLYFWTLHFGGYTLPSEPLYPWDKWETIYARSLQEQVRRLDASHEDDTRLFVYEILEKYMDQASGSVGLGRQCLLRGICENAQIHQHLGIVAELLNILLTPGKARLDLSYREAYAAGLAGSHCLEQFEECPRGKSVLDAFAVDLED
ncbi:uncharacterized protein LOC108152415 isoform X1 [Drosophila miranda]|uniref:uncharacterized protein LOC108152415 isoform X1 n=2 Tax=Drosophila miranda TaxID=7229 RepID=UPI00143F4A65|nr:uncharacterized protein LOC108152415 isoform X1 [Drosophila miranda]